MSIKLQMLSGAGRRAASFPRAPRAPFFLRRALNLRWNLFLLPRRGGTSRCAGGRGLPSVPGRGGQGEEGDLASLVAKWHRGIPGNSSKVLALNPTATLSKPLPAPLRPGSLPPAWALGAGRWAKTQPSPGRATGPAEPASSGRIATTIHLAPAPGEEVYEQRLISTTLSSKYYYYSSFPGTRMEAQVREIAEISLPGQPDFRSLSLNDCAPDQRGRAVKT